LDDCHIILLVTKHNSSFTTNFDSFFSGNVSGDLSFVETDSIANFLQKFFRKLKCTLLLKFFVSKDRSRGVSKPLPSAPARWSVECYVLSRQCPGQSPADKWLPTL